MSVARIDDARPCAVVTLEWNPNTGQFAYDAHNANLMEQLGMMMFACMTVYAQQSKQGELLIKSAWRTSADLSQG